MSTREQRNRLISRVRRSIVASSVAGSLGLAGYLGIASNTLSTTAGSNSGTTSSNTSDNSGTSTFTANYGTGTSITSGSGTSHATSSGS